MIGAFIIGTVVALLFMGIRFGARKTEKPVFFFTGFQRRI